MPAQTHFHAPASQQIDTSAEAKARAEAGPDIACPFCGTRNAASASECSQCGGDLTGGKPREMGAVVGALQTAPAPPIACPHCGASNPATATKCAQCGGPFGRAPAPVKEPKPAAGGASPRIGLGCILVGIAIAALIGVIAFMGLGRGQEVIATVQDVHWTYTVVIEQLQPVQYEAWHDEIPQGAQVLRCSERVRDQVGEPVAGSVEVCGTPYIVDVGTGQGEVVQDCYYEVYDDWCRFSVIEWRPTAHTAEASGSDLYPMWPQYSLTSDQRAGSASEQYVVLLLANDREYRYSPRSLDEYRLFQVGSQWLITTNRLGGVTSIQPQ
jgi:ribosomal protein L40E